MHNKHMSQFIPPSNIQKTAGTWTPTVSTHLTSDVRSAAAAAATLVVPIPIPSNSEFRQGAKLVSVDLFYKIATADLTDFATAALKKKTLPASGTGVSGADVTVTPDSGHDTAAKRKAQGDHTITLKLDVPAWVDDGDAYEAVFVLDCAATSVVTIFGARANFELRLG